ncbi:MAG TPA: hypothetical protein VGQ35_19260 [Dongiaceae bacterium]|jgi:hypothetical protein|nr:hypothetical protein [Dongiaceae bacterium]
MFDFHRWRAWLRDRAVDLEAEGFVTAFKINDKYLPGTCVEIQTNSLVGTFSNWENGFADYDFVDVRTGQISMEAMIPVDDSNFEAKFVAFVKRFREIE